VVPSSFSDQAALVWAWRLEIEVVAAA
jgi:hypothetical protein